MIGLLCMTAGHAFMFGAQRRPDSLQYAPAIIDQEG